MINTLAIANYRSLRNVVAPLGELNLVSGENGSGKSTLANVLSGRPGYEVTGGEVLFEGRDLLSMAPEERAREGVFLAFQYPVEIPGVNNTYFLRDRTGASGGFKPRCSP